MDYCIYKTINGENPRVIHTFTQAATKSHAKAAATKKLDDMWKRIVVRPTQFKNAKGSRNEITYEYQLTTEQTVKARFYIAPAPKKTELQH